MMPSTELSLPPPGTPEQVETTNAIALALLGVPVERRAAAVESIVWRYHAAIQREFPQYPDELHRQSTVNFIRALRTRYQSLHFAEGGKVARA